MGLFYDQVSLLVQPSFTEGFPNIILEAFINGKLVVGSEDAYPEEVSVFGDRIPLEMDLWIDSLKKWSEMSGGDRLNHGLNAGEYVKMFTWGNHGSRLAGQLQKAINLHDPSIG